MRLNQRCPSTVQHYNYRFSTVLYLTDNAQYAGDSCSLASNADKITGLTFITLKEH